MLHEITLYIQRSNRAQNIMPVTAAQILAVEQMDDRFFSGEIELHQVLMNYFLDAPITYFVLYSVKACAYFHTGTCNTELYNYFRSP